MLGDWLRAGNQVWLGKYWDSRTGGHCMKDSRDMRSEVDAYKYFFLRTPVMFNGRFILVFIERNQLRILSGSSTFWLTEERQDQG